MSYQDEEDPVIFTREATQIVITLFDGTPVDTIDLPEVTLRRSEVDPTWLAAREAKQLEKEQT